MPTSDPQHGSPDVTMGAVLEVYWRPGCAYCAQLRRTLARHQVVAQWHNIWTDQQARAFVRSVARGNETVPTVVFQGRAHVNPRPERVVDMVRKQFPHLVSETEPRRGLGGLLRRRS